MIKLYFRVWKGAGLCTHILEGHSDAITSVSIINPEGKEDNYILLNIANFVSVHFSDC